MNSVSLARKRVPQGNQKARNLSPQPLAYRLYWEIITPQTIDTLTDFFHRWNSASNFYDAGKNFYRIKDLNPSGHFYQFRGSEKETVYNRLFVLNNNRIVQMPGSWDRKAVYRKNAYHFFES